MWKPIYQPEPWPQFVKRKDIKGLPLMEQRKKFLQEQILFENYLSTLNTLNTVSPSVSSAASGGGGPKSGLTPTPPTPTPLSIQFSIDTDIQAPTPEWSVGSNFTQTLTTVHMFFDPNPVQFYYSAPQTPISSSTIDWGDGNVDTGITSYNTFTDGNPTANSNGLLGGFGVFPMATYTHSYAAKGTYDVTLTGEGIYSAKLAWLPLTNISQLDPTKVQDFRGYFLQSQANSTVAEQIASWDMSNATDLSFMFNNTAEEGLANFTSSWNPNVSSWNVSNVTSMNRTFTGMKNFNRDLSSWNVANCGFFYDCFRGCDRLVSGGRVDQWDFSGAQSNGMQQMFMNSMRDSTAVGSMPHVGGWNLSGVNNISKLFSGSGFSHTAVGETLIGWSSGSVANSINANQIFASTWDGAAFTNPVFNTGSAFGLEVNASYDYLVNTKGWTITDISFT